MTAIYQSNRSEADQLIYRVSTGLYVAGVHERLLTMCYGMVLMSSLETTGTCSLRWKLVIIQLYTLKCLIQEM